MRLVRCLPLLMAGALLAAPAPARDKKPAVPVKTGLPATGQTEDTGTYLDGAAKHAWAVTRGHALVWDGAATVPAGIEFRPAAWKADAPAGAADQDAQALSALHAAGVTDVLLSAPGGDFPAVSPVAVQKTLDAVNALGLRYGLRVSGVWPSALTAFSTSSSLRS